MFGQKLDLMEFLRPYMRTLRLQDISRFTDSRFTYIHLKNFSHLPRLLLQLLLLLSLGIELIDGRVGPWVVFHLVEQTNFIAK